jgi:glycosyltransferase involved in cell wall biosynthesis
MLKIGIDARCLEWQRGGVARYLINVLLHWQKVTADIKFILYFENQIPEDDFLKSPLFDLKVIGGPKILKSSRFFAYLLLMGVQARNDKVQIFFSPWYILPFFLGGIKTIVAAWDISYSTHPTHFPFKTRFTTAIWSRLSCRRANGVITCSDYDAGQISKFYKIEINKICVVYLAADARFTNIISQEKINFVRKKYKLPDKFLLSLGAIYTRRNLDVVIKAFEKLPNEYAEFSLVVVGKNVTRPYLDIEKLMNSLILSGRGVYLPWIEDDHLPYIYQSAYAYICTSTVDGETIQLKEAMKSGIPVVTSALLDRSIGGNGFIINDPTNINETVATFKSLFDYNGQFGDLIESGLEWNKKITWESIADRSLTFILSKAL